MAKIESLPTRGEWIEIYPLSNRTNSPYVSPHTGRVDWNMPCRHSIIPPIVSPHTGRVDWNVVYVKLFVCVVQSLPTRGEWIEICANANVAIKKKVSPHTGRVDWNRPNKRIYEWSGVSPHTGRVDWNDYCYNCGQKLDWSLPTRGEWIEIIPFVSIISAVSSVSPHTFRLICRLPENSMTSKLITVDVRVNHIHEGWVSFVTSIPFTTVSPLTVIIWVPPFFPPRGTKQVL